MATNEEISLIEEIISENNEIISYGCIPEKFYQEAKRRNIVLNRIKKLLNRKPNKK